MNVINNLLLKNSKNINPFTGAMKAKVTISKGFGPKFIATNEVPNPIPQKTIAKIKKLVFLARPLIKPNMNQTAKNSIDKIRFNNVGDGPSASPLLLKKNDRTIVKTEKTIFIINLLPPY